MRRHDITLLTDRRYHRPSDPDWYVANILEEDTLLRTALEARGMNVHRTFWDDPDMDWAGTRCALFRTTWDYFDRIGEFLPWLDRVAGQTRLLNSPELIQWNLDKRYLRDLAAKGTPIPPTLFLEPGEPRSLSDLVRETGWSEAILKPAVSGAARHTYRLTPDTADLLESTWRSLIRREALLLQEFQGRVLDEGEFSLMVMGGRFTHAVRKRAKPGDFRVQDDFGGTVHDFHPSDDAIRMAEDIVRRCSPEPLYARVDLLLGNDGLLLLSELELIEPELWFRNYPPAAEVLADEVVKKLQG